MTSSPVSSPQGASLRVHAQTSPVRSLASVAAPTNFMPMPAVAPLNLQGGTSREAMLQWSALPSPVASPLASGRKSSRSPGALQPRSRGSSDASSRENSLAVKRQQAKVMSQDRWADMKTEWQTSMISEVYGVQDPSANLAPLASVETTSLSDVSMSQRSAAMLATMPQTAAFPGPVPPLRMCSPRMRQMPFGVPASGQAQYSPPRAAGVQPLSPQRPSSSRALWPGAQSQPVRRLSPGQQRQVKTPSRMGSLVAPSSNTSARLRTPMGDSYTAAPAVVMQQGPIRQASTGAAVAGMSRVSPRTLHSTSRSPDSSRPGRSRQVSPRQPLTGSSSYGGPARSAWRLGSGSPTLGRQGKAPHSTQLPPAAIAATAAAMARVGNRM